MKKKIVFLTMLDSTPSEINDLLSILRNNINHDEYLFIISGKEIRSLNNLEIEELKDLLLLNVADKFDITGNKNE